MVDNDTPQSGVHDGGSEIYGVVGRSVTAKSKLGGAVPGRQRADYGPCTPSGPCPQVVGPVWPYGPTRPWTVCSLPRCPRAQYGAPRLPLVRMVGAPCRPRAYGVVPCQTFYPFSLFFLKTTTIAVTAT